MGEASSQADSATSTATSVGSQAGGASCMDPQMLPIRAWGLRYQRRNFSVDDRALDCWATALDFPKDPLLFSIGSLLFQGQCFVVPLCIGKKATTCSCLCL